MKTKNGIYNNLNESEYIYEIENFVFYFSSKMYLEKFKQGKDEYIKEETLKINNKYNTETKFNIMLLLSLYKKIEKRGFKIFDKVLNRDLKEKEVIRDMILK